MDHLDFQSVPETLEFILGNSWVEPADVQRDFQWTEAHVGDLLSDLIRHKERVEAGEADDPAAEMGTSYFMGMIIVHGSAHRFRVFDGLQRLTTLTILICVLRDLVDDVRLKSRLNACVWDNRSKPRLVLKGQPYLETHIQPVGKSISLARGAATGQRASLRTAQGFLRDALSGRDQDFLQGLATLLLEQVVLLQLRVRDEAVANIIFKSLNMRGLKLEEADLVKSRLAEFADSEREADNLVRQWQDVRQTLTARSQARDDEGPDESTHFDRYRGFQGFVLALEMMERADPPRAHYHPSDAQRIDRYVDWLKSRHNTPSGLSGYLCFLVKCAENWNLMNQPALGGKSSPFAPLLPVRAVRWTEWKPLVLRLMGVAAGMGKAGPDWRKTHFEAIHRACIAMQIVGFNSDKRALVFANALKELEGHQRPEELLALRMHDAHIQRIHDALTAPFVDHQVRRSVLLWTEYMLAGEDRFFLKRVTVEHVLPVSTDLTDEWTQAFPDWKQRRALVHLLGNLAIVPGEVNLGMGDDSFDAKQAHMAEAGEDLSAYQLLSWVRAQPEWTPAQIHQRTQALVERIWRELRLSEQSYSGFAGGRE